MKKLLTEWRKYITENDQKEKRRPGLSTFVEVFINSPAKGIEFSENTPIRSYEQHLLDEMKPTFTLIADLLREHNMLIEELASGERTKAGRLRSKKRFDDKLKVVHGQLRRKFMDLEGRWGFPENAETYDKVFSMLDEAYNYGHLSQVWADKWPGHIELWGKRKKEGYDKWIRGL